MTVVKLNTEAENFFKAIEPIVGGNSDITFNYLAVLHQGTHVLICSRLYFVSGKTKLPFTHIETKTIRAGQYQVSDLNCTARELVEQISNGKVKTPKGDLHFPINTAGSTHSVFHPHHEVGLANQNRLNVLHISSDGLSLDTVSLDWELKAAPTPFDGLHELIANYAIGEVVEHSSVFEAVAHNVMAVDAGAAISGTTANLKVRLVDGLPTDKASIGYRVLSNREVVARESVSGNELEWETVDGIQLGSTSITVPSAAVVQCIACYNGIAQSTYWIADNANFQNPRRTAYEAFDAGLSTLKDFLQLGPGTVRGKPQQDLEVGISWLLWMLGFSTAHLGATPRTQDAADLIVATPNGSIAVVECTLGLLKSENKLPNVVKRAEEVKERFKKSNNHHLQVIPVIVSSLSREKILADIEQAEKLGVLVLSSENLLEGINRSMLIPNADQYYRDAMEVIRAGQEKHRPRVTGTNSN